MDKLKELVKKLGISKDVIEDLTSDESKTDIDSVVNDYKTMQVELIKNDKKFIDEIVDDAAKTAKIVTEKTFKKTLNKKFGVGLTNTDIDKISVEELSEKIEEIVNTGKQKDVEEKDKEIIRLTNEFKEAKDNFETELKAQTERIFKKEDNANIEKAFLDKISDKNTIKLVGIDSAAALDYAILKAKSQFDFKVEYDDPEKRTNVKAIIPMKDGYPAKKSDNTGFLDIDTIVKDYLKPFTEQSNGVGAPAPANGVKVNIAGMEKELVVSQRQKELLEAEAAFAKAK